MRGSRRRSETRRQPPRTRYPGGDGRRSAVGLARASAYEALTRQMVEALTEELEEIKGRLNGLLFMVAGAIVVDVALRLAGVD